MPRSNATAVQPRALAFKTASVWLLFAVTCADALYFTSPQPGTVWQSPDGQVMTWVYQAGNAPVGTLVLETITNNPKGDTFNILANNVDLTSERLTWPDDMRIAGMDSNQFRLSIVNRLDSSDVYANVGPFTIESLAIDGPGTSPTSRGPRTPTTTPAVPVTSRTTTTTTPAPPPPPTTQAPAPAPTTTTTPATPPSSSAPAPVPTSQTDEPNAADDEPEPQPLTSTVMSTASAVTLTSTGGGNVVTGEDGVVTVRVTRTGSDLSPSTSASASGAVGNVPQGQGQGQLTSGAGAAAAAGRVGGASRVALAATLMVVVGGAMLL